METSPGVFFRDGMWYKKCAVCPNLISHRYKSQLAKQRTCSHRCQLLGNKHRSGHIPVNAFKPGETTGEKNHKWKGDDVGYSALHDWVRRVLGTPRRCENCGTRRKTKYEWANLSGQYLRNISDWVRLCKMCHVLIDGSDRGLVYNH